SPAARRSGDTSLSDAATRRGNPDFAQQEPSRSTAGRPLSTQAARVAMAIAFAACGSAGKSAGSTATAGDQKSPAELRDVRYWEVIPSLPQGTRVLPSVYNPLGYNVCPPARWAALTEDEVTRAFGSQIANLNGPLHWVIDSLKASGSSQT